MKKALFYATLALEEAFGVYRYVLRKYVETVQRAEVGEEPFKRVVYVADVGQIKQLADEEGKALENALKTLRKRLNEYAARHDLKGLLDVKEDVVRRLAEAKHAELSEFNDVSFGVKALAALMAYREYVLSRGAPSARRLGTGLRWAGRPGSSTMRRPQRTTMLRRRGWRDPRRWRSW
jgi:hypothetical protein